MRVDDYSINWKWDGEVKRHKRKIKGGRAWAVKSWGLSKLSEKLCTGERCLIEFGWKVAVSRERVG